jgi:hypothetical protein
MCEGRPLIFRDEYGPSDFETVVVRKQFEPKWKEVVGGWRNLLIEGIYDICYCPIIVRALKSRRIRWRGRAVRVMVGKSEGKRRLV